MKNIPVLSPAKLADWKELISSTKDIDVVLDWLLREIPAVNFPEMDYNRIDVLFSEDDVIHFLEDNLELYLDEYDKGSIENIIIDWIKKMKPEKVFDKEALEKWATSNGFIKKD
jgi:hypothetical protein